MSLIQENEIYPENWSQNNDLMIGVPKVIDEEKYFQQQIKKLFLQQNQITKETYEESNVSMTYRRGKDEKIQIKQQIQINLKNLMNYELKTRYLEKEEFRIVTNFLLEQNMVLKEYLNSGGQADVYFGWKINEKGDKEEKVFRIIKASQQEDVQEITKEFEKVNAIFQPQNLIQYDGLLTFEKEKIIIFIMKKYSGSLKDKLSDKLNNSQFLNLALNLFEGLIELRVNNIIHSDIKPHNVLIDQDSKCFYSDFGYSLKLKQKQALSGYLGYTEKYCSPEQEQKQTISYASDMYSLGKVVFEMSEQLPASSFKQTIQKFLQSKILLNNSEERISVEELIPQFIIATSLNYDRKIIEGYLIKIQNSFKLEQLEFRINTSKNLKIILSNKLVAVILNYLFMNQSSGISYDSLYQNQFQGLNTLDIANLFYEIACLPGNTLSNDKIEESDKIKQSEIKKNKNKVKYLNDSLKVLEQMPPSYQRDELLAKVLFYLGQLFLINENFVEALEKLNKTLELTEINNFPKYLKKRVILFLGKIHFYMNDKAKSTDLFKQFEETFNEKQEDKYKEIMDQFLFAQTLEECGDQELSLKYYELIINYWDTIFGQNMNELTNLQQLNALKIVSQSYLKQKRYDSFLYVQIQYLKQIFQSEEGLYHFEVEVYKFQHILIKSDPETVNNQFDIMNDIYSEDPLFNKVVLVPFIVAFFQTKNFEKLREALDKFNSIPEKIPFSSSFQVDMVNSMNLAKEGDSWSCLKIFHGNLFEINDIIKERACENKTDEMDNISNYLSNLISSITFLQSHIEVDHEIAMQKWKQQWCYLEKFCDSVQSLFERSESEEMKQLGQSLPNFVRKWKTMSPLNKLSFLESSLPGIMSKVNESLYKDSNNQQLKDQTFQQKEIDQNDKNDENDKKIKKQ